MTDPGASLGAGALQRSLLDTIGDTPIVELRHFCDESKGRIFAKLESRNPSGSKYDRVAKQVIGDARAEGRLGRCQTVVAAVEGVGALAFAQVCAIMRHPFSAVISRAASGVPVAALTALGCEVIWVDQDPTSPPGRLTPLDRELTQRKADEVVAITGAFDPQLLTNRSAFRAHRLGTGQEIVRQVGGEFGAFVDFVATGATLAGCAAAFHEFDATIRCFAVEPKGAATLSGEAAYLDDHGIDGGGLGLPVLPLLSPERLAGIVQVTRQDAHKAAVELAQKEGILCGLSAGASLVAARSLLDAECFGESIVIVVSDNGVVPTSESLAGRLADAA
ncbi:MAG: pyridoxal-phosphate dependent enzyme [Planctomycetota bacterium]